MAEVRYVPLELWRRCLREEYFETFLKAGGGTVKILVADDGQREAALDAVVGDAHAAGLTVFDFRENPVSLHKMDELWFAVARQVDWDGLADRYVRRVSAEMGFPMDDPDEPCTLVNVCSAYDVDRSQVMANYMRSVRDVIFRDYDLDIDFRKSLTHLVNGKFLQTNEMEVSLAKQWLTSPDVYTRDLRAIQIFQKIDRTRARPVLNSLIKALSSLGSPSIFCFDGAKYYTERNRLGYFRYNRPQLFDLFEIIREFIDEADSLRGAAVVFAFPPDFVESERRSFAIYWALRTRVADEVRDRDRGNPCAAMVRVRV